MMRIMTTTIAAFAMLAGGAMAEPAGDTLAAESADSGALAEPDGAVAEPKAKADNQLVDYVFEEEIEFNIEALKGDVRTLARMGLGDAPPVGITVFGSGVADVEPNLHDVEYRVERSQADRDAARENATGIATEVKSRLAEAGIDAAKIAIACNFGNKEDYKDVYVQVCRVKAADLDAEDLRKVYDADLPAGVPQGSIISHDVPNEVLAAAYRDAVSSAEKIVAKMGEARNENRFKAGDVIAIRKVSQGIDEDFGWKAIAIDGDIRKKVRVDLEVTFDIKPVVKDLTEEE